MNLQTLSDESLHERNIQCAKEEREILTRILHQLKETERRRLYSKYKCGSLFDYAVNHLKYSSDQADRRIKAMRLLKDLPEVESQINSGALTLTNLALAQKLFGQQKKSGRVIQPQEKIEVLKKLEHQTTRAAEKIVFEIEPMMKPKSRDFEFHHIEDDSLREKLLQVKGLFSHTNPNLTLTELLHKLCDQEIAKKTQERGTPKINSKAELRRQIWRRDQGKCSNCGSSHAIQIEHKTPRAVGGKDSMENLCLLCRACNQRRAIEYYGLPKMQKYLKSPIMDYLPGGKYFYGCRSPVVESN